MEWLEIKSIVQQFEVAINGAIGGLVRVFLGKEKKFGKAIIIMIVGAIGAHFLTPMVVDLVDRFFESDMSDSLGFLTGYTAMILFNRVEDFAKGTSFGKLFKR